MKKRISKILRVFFVLIVVISQLGILPVYAQKTAESTQKLSLTSDKRNVKVGDEVTVTVRGDEKLLKEVTLKKDASLKEVKRDVKAPNYKTFVYRVEKAGEFKIIAKARGNESNVLLLNAVNKDKVESQVKSETNKGKRDSNQEYTVALSAPKEVEYASANGYNGFSYVVTLNSQATSTNPTTGVVLTFTPPVGYELDDIQTGPNTPVKSYTVNANGVVTIVLNDLTQGIIDFNISVKLVTDESKPSSSKDRYNGEKLEADLTGNPDSTGKIPSDSAETILKGKIKYNANKTLDVTPGSGNRHVTYSFNARKNIGETQMPLNEISFTDDIPAGAIIESHEDSKGTWKITGNQASGWHAVWNYKGLINNVAYLSDIIGSVPKLVVVYPEDKFPSGSKPPVNSVDLAGKDIKGQEWTGTPSSVQEPDLAQGSSTVAGISKEITTASKTWKSGAVYVSYAVKGSFLTSPTGKTAKQFTVTDEKSDFSNKAFWSHFYMNQVKLEFNSTLISSQADYRLEYKTTAQGDWRVADKGKTSNNLINVGFQIEGSTDYAGKDKHTKTVNLKKSEVLTGWRVVLYDTQGKDIGKSSDVKATVTGVGSAANIYDKNITDNLKNLKNTTTNEVVLEDNTKLPTTDASASVNISKNIYLGTSVTAPSSLKVDEKNNYEVQIANATPEEDFENGILRVVLPAGVTYDASVGASAKNAKTEAPYNFNVPQVGKGVTVTTEMLPAGNGYNYSRQVVVFKFNESILSMRNAGDPSSRFAEFGGYIYNVPVNVSKVAYEAYQSSGQRAPVESWVTTDDKRYDDYTILGINNQNDKYDFDKIRSDLVWSQGNSQILSQGGLLLSKFVEGTKGSGFSDKTETSDDADATWKIVIRNTLATIAEKPVVFDNLTKINGNSNFTTTLTGPIKVAANAKVEYSKNATTANNGTWTSTWQDATSFKVTFPDMQKNDSFEINVPVHVPESVGNGDLSINMASGVAKLNGQELSYSSNKAEINVNIQGGSVELIKYDNKTNKVLAGAVFELQDEKGKVLQSGLTTDIAG
ncbi:hypothetical protein, partial [Dellaglioa algida]